ncbi:MAG: TonB-dependent receptor [Lentisphaerae bacterium]|nr:TonB-dependent receptor [Lentisphaerota bacterium]
MNTRMIGGMLAVGMIICNCVASSSGEEDIVVVATRSDKTADQIPANVTVITSEDIKNAGHENVVEALENVGGIYIRSTSGSLAGSEVGMRGFGESSHGRVLVLLDGRRLNRPDMSTINWLQIPIANVDRIEVIRGGNSVLYGDHALAGVVNIVTKEGQINPESYVTLSGGSFGDLSVRLGTVGSLDKLSYSAQGESCQSEGYRDRSAYASSGVGIRMGYDVTESITLDFGMSGQMVSYEMPGQLTKEEMEADPKSANNLEDEADESYYNVDFNMDMSLAEGHRIGMNASFGLKDVVLDMTSWGMFNNQEMNTFRASPVYVADVTVAGMANSLLMGVDYYADILGLDRYMDVGRSGDPATARLTRNTIGAYLKDDLYLTKAMILGVGGRMETSRLDAKVVSGGVASVDDSKTHNVTAFDVSVVYAFENQSKLFAKTASIYRYPFVDEQVSYHGWGDNFDTMLEPEEGWTADVGANIGIGAKLNAGITVFFLQMRNEIAYAYDASMGVFRNQNLDETRRQGVEFDFAYFPISMLTVRGNYTYTDAEFSAGDNNGNDIPLVPESKASAGVEVKLPLGLSAIADATYIGKSYFGGDAANNGGQISEHTVVDILLRHKSDAVEGLELYVAVDNVFDEKYASYVYSGGGYSADAYYPSPGIAVRGGMSYRF